MWKRGGRSSALDRAQALLSGRRGGRGAAEPAGDTAATARGAVGASVRTRRSSPDEQFSVSDVSDVSSAILAPEDGADTPAAAAGGALGREGGGPAKDFRPQSSLGGGGGGGSRFLKKAPPPAAICSQSPVRRSHLQPAPEHRNVSSSQRRSQTAALSRLAQIESRVRRIQEPPRPAENLSSDLRISPPAAAPSLEAAAPSPAVQSSSEQSLRGKRFLKNKTAVNSSDLPPAAVGSRSRSRAVELSGLEMKSVTAVRGVSLESDEDDMRKLLGDSVDSSNNSLLTAGRRSSRKPGDKTSRFDSSPPPAAPPRSPASPPARHSSPFRFTGQARARFSPLSSLSGRGEELLSLDELFSAGDPHSELSEDFKINVMTLDELGFTEETPGEREADHSSPRPAAPNRSRDRERLKEEKKKEEEEEEQQEVLDYQSDFESESRTEPDHSASLVSEHLQGDEEEEEVREEVREEASDSGRTEDDYSSTFSDPSTLSRSRSSCDSRTSSHRSGRRAVLKEAAVQTEPGPPAGVHTASVSYVDPSPAVAHALSAEMVEALSTFNPSVFALNEMLRQQLAMTRRFIENSRRLHSSLVQSLGPPSYRYTTLEDTRQLIRQHRRPKATVEEALEDQI